MGMPEKVVKFENENMKIYEVIQGWLKYLNRNNRDYEQDFENKNTQKTYEVEVRAFFHAMRGKEKGNELEFLTKEDLQITLDDIEAYKEELMDERENGKYKYTNKTINKKIAALKNFIRYMARKKFIEDASYLNLIKSEKEKTVHYGTLSVEEVFTMSELAKQEREKGYEKSILILLAMDTCIRKSALLNLKWSNFIERDGKIIIEGVDKGNKDFRDEISRGFYEQILALKRNDSDKVFSISDGAIQDMMTRLKKRMNIDPARKITFHSLRRTGANFRYRVSGGDIKEAQKALNHSNVSTTGIYVDSLDYGALGAVSSAGKLDKELYTKVGLETLVQAISECNTDVQLLVNMKLQEIIKENN